jgi:hypothetical protein
MFSLKAKRSGTESVSLYFRMLKRKQRTNFFAYLRIKFLASFHFPNDLSIFIFALKSKFWVEIFRLLFSLFVFLISISLSYFSNLKRLFSNLRLFKLKLINVQKFEVFYSKTDSGCSTYRSPA